MKNSKEIYEHRSNFVSTNIRKALGVEDKVGGGQTQVPAATKFSNRPFPFQVSSQGGDPTGALQLQAIKEKIQSSIIFSPLANTIANSSALYSVMLRTDGTVDRVVLERSSGLDDFDEAVKIAIVKSQPFGYGKNGKSYPGFALTFPVSGR